MPPYKRSAKPRRKMPVKKTYRKAYKKAKKHFLASKAMVTYIDKSSLVPFPPKYRCRFSTQLAGRCILDPGTITGNTTAVVQMCLNDPTSPWSVSSYTIGDNSQPYGWSAGSPAAVPLLPTDATGTIIGTPNDVQPSGIRALLKDNLASPAPYANYRVFSSTCKARISPINSTAGVNLSYQVVLVPIAANAVNYFNTIPPEIEDARVQPFARTMVVTTTNSKMIKNSVSQHKLLGVRKEAIENDLSGNYTNVGLGGQPLNQSYWVLMVGGNQNVSAAQGQIIQFDYEIELQYYCECFNSNLTAYIQSY